MDIHCAQRIQHRLKQKLEIIPFSGKLNFLAGVDAAFREDKAIGTACLFSFPDFLLIEETRSIKKIGFPYLPGYLSFREVPALLAALKKPYYKPDFDRGRRPGDCPPQRTGAGLASGDSSGHPHDWLRQKQIGGRFFETGQEEGRLDSFEIGPGGNRGLF
jgi:deoxyribonuclease V